MKLPSADQVIEFSFPTIIFGVIGIVAATLLTMLVGYQFTTNTPTYCYVDYRGTERRYEYNVYQHRTFGPDNTVAAVHSYHEAAEAIELLCR